MPHKVSLEVAGVDPTESLATNYSAGGIVQIAPPAYAHGSKLCSLRYPPLQASAGRPKRLDRHLPLAFFGSAAGMAGLSNLSVPKTNYILGGLT
jgi:hypothetical protein